jgi:hypothetical protein
MALCMRGCIKFSASIKVVPQVIQHLSFIFRTGVFIFVVQVFYSFPRMNGKLQSKNFKRL